MSLQVDVAFGGRRGGYVAKVHKMLLSQRVQLAPQHIPGLLKGLLCPDFGLYAWTSMVFGATGYHFQFHGEGLYTMYLMPGFFGPYGAGRVPWVKLSTNVLWDGLPSYYASDI